MSAGLKINSCTRRCFNLAQLVNISNFRKKWITASGSYSQFASGFSMPMPKSLNEIIKLNTMESLEADEIASLWNDYHIGRGHISAVMNVGLYSTFRHRAENCRMFILPVLKPKGFVTMFMQAQVPHILFTGLEDYKIRGVNASPFFAATHYTDLAESKGIVLVRGDVILPSQLSDNEACELLKKAHASFLDERLYKHVQAFNKDANSFEYRDWLRDMGVSS